MMRTAMVAALVVVAAAASGCASARNSPAASPAFTPQTECERNGGWWHPEINYCEYQAPTGPSR